MKLQVFVAATYSSRFLDTVAKSHPVRRIFKRCCNLVLGISQFDIYMKAIGEVIKEVGFIKKEKKITHLVEKKNV